MKLTLVIALFFSFAALVSEEFPTVQFPVTTTTFTSRPQHPLIELGLFTGEPESLNTQLFKAAFSGEQARVTRLLCEGADPDFVVDSRWPSSVLHYADPSVVSILIRARANIRAATAATRPSSVFAVRLIETLKECDTGGQSLNKGRCVAHKEALQHFFQTDSFPDGLTDSEVIQEIGVVKEYYNGLFFAADQELQELESIAIEVCPPQVTTILYPSKPLLEEPKVPEVTHKKLTIGFALYNHFE